MLVGALCLIIFGELVRLWGKVLWWVRVCIFVHWLYEKRVDHNHSACSALLPPASRAGGTFFNGGGVPTRVDCLHPLHAQRAPLHLIIAVCGPESVLPDVVAIHTIEVIPKSMILAATGTDRRPLQLTTVSETVSSHRLRIRVGLTPQLDTDTHCLVSLWLDRLLSHLFHGNAISSCTTELPCVEDWWKGSCICEKTSSAALLWAVLELQVWLYEDINLCNGQPSWPAHRM